MRSGAWQLWLMAPGTLAPLTRAAACDSPSCLRLAYFGVANAFAMLRLLPMSGRDRTVEILALRHRTTVLERQLGKEKVPFSSSDWAFLAALLHRLPMDVLRRLRLLIRPDTVLRWHRNLLARRHAATPPAPARSAQAGRAPCAPSALWSCARPGRIPTGASGASTANCWSSA